MVLLHPCHPLQGTRCMSCFTAVSLDTRSLHPPWGAPTREPPARPAARVRGWADHSSFLSHEACCYPHQVSVPQHTTPGGHNPPAGTAPGYNFTSVQIARLCFRLGLLLHHFVIRWVRKHDYYSTSKKTTHLIVVFQNDLEKKRTCPAGMPVYETLGILLEKLVQNK